MICPNCHSEISDTSLFCPVCNFQIVSATGIPNTPNNSYSQPFVQNMSGQPQNGNFQNMSGQPQNPNPQNFSNNPQADMMNDQILSDEAPYQNAPQSNMYGTPQGNPYGTAPQYSNIPPQGNMYGTPQGNPYGPQYSGAPQGNPYGTAPQYSNIPPQGNMYGAQIPYYSQNNTGEGKATAALVIGIISLSTCWVPFVGLIFSIIGLILSATSKNSDGTKPTPAIVGLVLSILSIIVAAIITIIVICFIVGLASW